MNDDPCGCEEKPFRTKCDRDTKNNIWLERGTPGAIGICLLDTMTHEQVIYTLERNVRAKADLLRITSDPELLELANTVERLPTMPIMDAVQKHFNREGPETNIFHSLFRGQVPWNRGTNEP